jgi:hypothetical protein
MELFKLTRKKEMENYMSVIFQESLCNEKLQERSSKVDRKLKKILFEEMYAEDLENVIWRSGVKFEREIQE